MNIVRRILIAVKFLTILPLPGKEIVAPRELGKSMAYFPLVGMFIGLLLACVYMVLIKFISPLLTAVLLTGFWACFTGFLHLEGFVDAADGFSASPDKEKILEVMKDQHCGAKGAIVLVFLIILKIALFNEIPGSERIYALILTPAIGRWVMVCAASLCLYARKGAGFGKDFVENAGKTELIIASSILISAGVCLLRIKFIVLMIPVLFFAFIVIFYAKKRINGVTGDVLGAVNELTEVVSLGAFLFLR